MPINPTNVILLLQEHYHGKAPPPNQLTPEEKQLAEDFLITLEFCAKQGSEIETSEELIVDEKCFKPLGFHNVAPSQPVQINFTCNPTISAFHRCQTPKSLFDATVMS